MTYEDFLKAFINENKSKVSRDRLFGGYDIDRYDYDKMVNKCYWFITDKMNLEFPRPDIDSEEYHDYYRNMMENGSMLYLHQKQLFSLILSYLILHLVQR